ncbi:MAG: molecular chaperone DnaK [Myxococcales bacterium]|nr:molecular chaperone DnaK [Myxococcales bacterium]
MEYVVGIDLGTTNSCVAIVENGEPRVIANKAGLRTTPSVIAISESGRRLVGHLAKRQLLTNPTHTIYAAKRLIGRKWDSPSARKAASLVPYELVEGPHGDVRIRLREQVFSLPEVSAFILQEMRLIAEAHVGAPIDRAVITVPAYFNDNQRQATKDAGTIAGLEVLRIINEPTAAALAYGFGRDLERKVAVYDFGGGTFDISILDIGDGLFEVVATGGDSFLGGEDFDQRVVEYLITCMEVEDEEALREDRVAMQRIRDAAEKARCELSEQEKAEVDLPFLHTTGAGQVYHLRETLSRGELEDLSADLVERTVGICEQALADANLEKASIDDVVLVGGMTRMPLIQRRVAELFGREPCQGVNPDELVALGAAIQAAALAHETEEVLLLDVTPHSLGIMIAGGYFHRLIEKNTTVPTRAGHVYTTTRDDQSSVKLLVLQGESDKAADNELLGEFILSGLRKAPRGQVQVDVSFSISVDGIVSVSARDLATGHEQTITVTASSGLTDDELHRLIRESDAFMVEARASEELARRRRQVERLMGEIQAIVPRVREVMTATRFGREALGKVDDALARGDRELHIGDPRSLSEAMESLERAQVMLRGIAERSGR